MNEMIAILLSQYLLSNKKWRLRQGSSGILLPWRSPQLGDDRNEVLRNRNWNRISWTKFRFLSTGTGFSFFQSGFLSTGTGILKNDSGFLSTGTGIPADYRISGSLFGLVISYAWVRACAPDTNMHTFKISIYNIYTHVWYCWQLLYIDTVVDQFACLILPNFICLNPVLIDRNRNFKSPIRFLIDWNRNFEGSFQFLINRNSG